MNSRFDGRFPSAARATFLLTVNVRFLLAAILLTAAGAAYAAPPTATNVNISGTPEVGQTLTGNYTYNDVDGDLEGTSTFRWLRNGSQIGGATGTNYTLVGADQGAQIIFEVTPVAATGESPGLPVQSPAVGPINPANTAPTATNVSISGTPEVGQTLTGNYTYNDVDGDLEGTSTFRWLRNGSQIGGATGTNYTLVGADQGANIRFEVTPAAQTGVSPGAPVQSPNFGPIGAANTAPTATNVSISGTPEVGQTLTGNYTYNDVDGDLEGTSTFRWLRNGSQIGGATGTNYTLVGADQGAQIIFEVTPVAATGESPGLPVQSPAVGPINPANTAPTATNVSISGTPEVGQTLTGNYTYNDVDGDLEGTSTFRWLRNGSQIGGATGTNYTLVGADQGANIRFEVTPAAQTGVSPGAPVQSPNFGPIGAANTAPTATNVSISGTPEVGQTLSGNYTYNDADGDEEGTSIFRWLRDGSAILGATGTTYTVVTADVNTNLRFEVTPVAQTGISPGTPVQSADFPISNVAPVINSQNPIEFPEDTSRTIVLADVDATDPDGDDNSLTVQVQDGANYTRSGVNGNTVTPDLNFNGTLTVPVTVNDGFVDSAVFNLNVTVTPVNDPPVFNGIASPPGELIVEEDFSLTIDIDDLDIDDPDGDTPVDLQLQPGANYTIAGDGAAVTPAENFNGTLTVGATVGDGDDPSLRSAPFTFNITVESVNDLPVLAAEIADQNAIEGTPFSLNVSTNFVDADDEPLNFTVDWFDAAGDPVAGPPNINFNANTGTFSGTPQLIDTEPPGPVYQVTVTAFDPAGAQAGDTFTLTISALGRANLALAISVTPETGAPNDQLQWTFLSTNPVGPVAGENVELAGSFVGSGLTVSALGAAACTITQRASGADFICNIGALPVGGTSSITLATTPNQTTEIVGFATTEGRLPVPIDPNTDDNSDLEAAGVADAFSAGAVQILGQARVLSVDTGDVNGDGAVDIVVGTTSGTGVQVFIAAPPRETCLCQRDFQAMPISIPDNAANRGVGLGDFDNDGDLDLVVANGGGVDNVYENNGAGNFTFAVALEPSNANGVGVGDFDNDGFDDFAIAAASPNPVYFGNGNLSFTRRTTLGDADSFGVAVGDFDGNARDDLAFANINGPSTVWTNSGGTAFNRRDQINIGDAVAVAAGDFNGQGVDDLVFGRVPGAAGDIPANPVLINGGSGNFGNPRNELGISPTADVAAGDLNRDGTDDIVIINESGVHQIWLGSGNGFTLHPEQIIDLGASAAVLADLGDFANGEPGGVDLALGSNLLAAGAGVYLNDTSGSLGRADNEPPEITLLGDAAVSVEAGTGYVDAGVQITDNIDSVGQGITLITDNPVNTAVVGSYTVTYNATDFAGNEAAPVTRAVQVTPSAGGGGGGGGALSAWAVALLAGLTLAFFAYTRRRPQERRVRIRRHRGE